MKTITIDFSEKPAQISDKILGYQGEHNRTELIITPPVEMTEDQNIISYAVAFQVGAYRVVHSEICDKADSISVLIERKVSKTNVISLQLEGYDGEENLLVKSELITDLIFENSVTGEEYKSVNESGLAEQVAFIKNELFKNSGEKLKTIKLNNTPIIPISTMDDLCIEISVDTDQIHPGDEVKTIRFLYNDKMVDIRNLMEVDGIPYILNMGKAYLSINGMLTLAMITKVNEGTVSHESFIFGQLANFEISEMEIDVYEQRKE